ncbi:class I SAM-dependent methyltransferase [Kineosporia sp. A_224]|uniref:class I SAM-dependent methyltransferase n=1 Tax=Kineosporia sp. A_224 TaxID=1962180 RepID=UPI000B4A6FFC|nr:class I SAM-dependent methyltransferase [Kineosporia sp. A_224]
MTQSEDDVAAVYDAAADLYADMFPSTDPEQPVDLAMVDHFCALLAADGAVGPDGPEVLDAGCGAGRMLPVLAAAGCRAVGADLSPEMVRRARQDHPGFETRVGSLTALPYPDGSFDGVLSWYSTIHTPHERLDAALAEIRRVLRPRGLVLVAFQAGEGSRDVAQGMRRLGLEVVLVRHHRTPEQMAEALRDNGFEEVARLVRAPVPPEADDQAALVARRTSSG